MSDFVSNLIDRHTQTEGNVTPRVRGRFESALTPATSTPDELSAATDWTAPNPWPRRLQSEQDFTDNQSLIVERNTPMKPGFWSAKQTAGSLAENSMQNPVLKSLNKVTESIDVETGQQAKVKNVRPDNQQPALVKPALNNPNAPDANWPNTRSGGLLGEPNRLPDFRLNSPENRNEQAPTTPAQPSINVTIGRIDVRAMPSPTSAPTPAKSAPKPQLSLDDYLKQRNSRPT